jgi:hypothetical protein
MWHNSTRRGLADVYPDADNILWMIVVSTIGRMGRIKHVRGVVLYHNRGKCVLKGCRSKKDLSRLYKALVPCAYDGIWHSDALERAGFRFVRLGVS